MKITQLRIQNYRSIVDTGEMRIEPFQAFVGENNAGKSNILRAIQVFLTSGAGGVNEKDYFDVSNPIIITITFSDLSEQERRRLKRYQMGDSIILEKHITLEEDPRSGKAKFQGEYRGYLADPVDWWLTVEGVIEHENTQRPNWEQVAIDHEIIDYVRKDDGSVNKDSYRKGIINYLIEAEEIEYEVPELGDTQALGYQSVLLDELPLFRLLSAITDYSSEIDRRSSKTSFRLLMGDLSDRIIQRDPRYLELERNLDSIKYLLNTQLDNDGDAPDRLEVLGSVEESLLGLISKLMPSVKGVKLEVEVDQIRDIFSSGVSLSIDDGKLTEVLKKGHGLQRCVVFSLLQALILNQRGEFLDIDDQEENESHRMIILAIEEPELYIHPQMQRIIYRVLSEFSTTDQVLFSTHSPAFIEISNYQSITVVRKENYSEGTQILQCDPGVLEAESERKTFQFFSSFGLEKNKAFFAQKIILVEGIQDVISIIATGRELSLFEEFPEEIGYSIIVTDSKQELPKMMKLLNSFGIDYVLLHEMDGEPDSEINVQLNQLLESNRSVIIENTLEDILNHDGHFSRAYSVKKFFEDPSNITDEFKQVVRNLFLIEED